LEPVGEILQLDEIRGDVGQRPSTACILDGVRPQSFDQSSGFGDGSGIAEGYNKLCQGCPAEMSLLTVNPNFPRPT
jgi:hypothetical protein